tara:strand:- start:24 stop:575 length:552 start_codon:yes stop_codon:yes gene_type:complete
MKIYISLIFSSFLLSTSIIAQDKEDKDFKLDNVLVVAQQDKQEDRYSLEVSLMQLFNSYDIKTKASLNVVKQGGSPKILLNDSVQKSLKNEGIDTYMLISVRGYDKRFKPSENIKSLDEELEAGHLFPLYRESATSVTFSITFYKDGEPVHYELIRTGTVGSRDAVLKKLMRKLDRSLRRKWL